MPVDWKRYPPHWKEISWKIRERSGGQCECHGECGLHKTNPGPRRCCERNGEPAVWAKGKIVLTVAHLGAPRWTCPKCKKWNDSGRLAAPVHCECGELMEWMPGDPHDKMDVRDVNLKALCQRCHLRYDAAEHAKNSARTREAKKNRNHLLLPLDVK